MRPGSSRGPHGTDDRHPDMSDHLLLRAAALAASIGRAIHDALPRSTKGGPSPWHSVSKLSPD